MEQQQPLVLEREVVHAESFSLSDTEVKALGILTSGILRPEHIYEIINSPSFPQFAEALVIIRRDLDSEIPEGGILFAAGPMRSGKTLLALAIAFSLFHKQNVVFAKSKLDERDPDAIKSAAGPSTAEANFENFSTVFFGENNELNNPDTLRSLLNAELLVIDELLFCSAEELNILYTIANARRADGKWTIICSLDKDFKRDPMRGFTDFKELDPILVDCSARCARCGLDAVLSQRSIDTGESLIAASVDDQVVVAEKGKDHYAPACVYCHACLEELNPREEEIFQGHQFLALTRSLLEDLSNQAWVGRGENFEAWQEVRIAEWRTIREESFFNLTRYDVALLTRITEVYKLYLQINVSWADYINALCIEGSVAVGKSTLIALLRGQYDVPQVKEDVKLNRWLSFSLSLDPKVRGQTAFPTQVYYRITKIEGLLREMHRIMGILALGGNPALTILIDRWLKGDGVFIERHLRQGNISEEEFDILIGLETLFMDKFPKSIYAALLVSDVSKMLDRIRIRGRPFETSLTYEDLYRIQEATQEAIIAMGIPPGFWIAIDTTEDTEPPGVAVLNAFLQFLSSRLLTLPKKVPKF
ncbi:MAG: deoxynucleoside kinase [Promethearchaeota archaeon]